MNTYKASSWHLKKTKAEETATHVHGNEMYVAKANNKAEIHNPKTNNVLIPLN